MVTTSVLVDMYDIFGDGGDYAWALYDDEVWICCYYHYKYIYIL
jgi:hypothetical protein